MQKHKLKLNFNIKHEFALNIRKEAYYYFSMLGFEPKLFWFPRLPQKLSFSMSKAHILYFDSVAFILKMN